MAENVRDAGMTPKGLFVGLCTKDIVYYTDEIPKKNHKIKTDDFATYIGGPAANAAITYAALGGDATLATCLGMGPESEAIMKELIWNSKLFAFCILFFESTGGDGGLISFIRCIHC